MLVESLLIQYWKPFTGLNFIYSRLLNHNWTLSNCRGFYSIKVCCILLKYRTLTTNIISVYLLSIESSCILLKHFRLWINRSSEIDSSSTCSLGLSLKLNHFLSFFSFLKHYLFVSNSSFHNFFYFCCFLYFLSRLNSIILCVIILLTFSHYYLLQINVFGLIWIHSIKFSHVLFELIWSFNNIFQCLVTLLSFLKFQLLLYHNVFGIQRRPLRRNSKRIILVIVFQFTGTWHCISWVQWISHPFSFEPFLKSISLSSWYFRYIINFSEILASSWMKIPNDPRPSCCPWDIPHVQLLEEQSLSSQLLFLRTAPLDLTDFYKLIVFISHCVSRS